MVYMAGDNGRIFEDGSQLMGNLESYGWGDIHEMSSVGSTADVAIVVQYDTLDAHETPRLYIDGETNTGTVIETVPPINTGDPQNLTDFIIWAEKTYPADNYALILWNHGTGWKEDDIYARYRKAEGVTKRDHLVRAVKSRKRMLGQTLFLSTAAEIMTIQDDETRAICYDDTSMDFLDNQALVDALVGSERQTGKRLAVLGMDACLMSMVEVAYQVRKHADFMVGSQEIEAGTGWPYDLILQELVTEPSMPALDLSKLIVDKFGEYYMSHRRDGGGINTQAAVDLRMIPQTFSLIYKASKRIAEVYADDFKTELAITRAHKDVGTFKDKDYVDLRHLMTCIRDEYSGPLDIDRLANNLFNHLAVECGPIIANFHGYGQKNANGLSIYFPARQYSPFYDNQDFASSGWGDVIRQSNRMALTKMKTSATDVCSKKWIAG
jgi:hypothetical protein